MKTLFAIIAIFGLLSFTTRGPDKKEIAGMLNNTQTRQEIFRVIQDNPQMLTEFMKDMHGNQKGMASSENYMANRDYMLKMIRSNPGWMRNMIDNMFSVCATDSVMSRDLVNTMHRYHGMMDMMNGYMYRNGMMSGNGNSMMHYYNDK